jgi:hypothetical protein
MKWSGYSKSGCMGRHDDVNVHAARVLGDAWPFSLPNENLTDDISCLHNLPTSDRFMPLILLIPMAKNIIALA